MFSCYCDPIQDIGEQVAIEETALHPGAIDNIVADRRPLREIFAAPMVQLAILSMTIGYFVMAFLMVITPLHYEPSRTQYDQTFRM